METELPIVRYTTLERLLGPRFEEPAPRTEDVLSPSGKPGERLTIFLHGFASDPEEYAGLLDLIHRSNGADLYAPSYHLGTYSKESPDGITQDLAKRFNRIAADYPEVHFVAHSMGAPFLRAAFLESLGSRDQPTHLRKLLERGAVRMTFLAATSRGYSPTNWKQILELGLLRRWFWLTLSLIAVAWCLRAANSTYDQGIVSTAAQWIWNGIFAATVVSFLFGKVALAPLIAIVCSLWLTVGISGSIAAVGIMTVLTAVSVLAMGAWLGRRVADSWKLAVVAAGAGLATPWFGVVPAAAYPAALAVFALLALQPMRTGLLLEHILYGAPWITGVRLRWMEAFADRGPGSIGLRPPPIVHLFGDEDRLVGDDDHVELHRNANAVEVALQGVTHNDFQISQQDAEWDKSFARGAYERKTRKQRMLPSVAASIQWALQTDPVELQRQSTGTDAPVFKGIAERSTPTKFRFVKPVVARANRESFDAPADEHLVFLIHGIRDFAEWQDSLAAKFESVAEAKSLKLIDVVQVRYGYFSALQFLLSGERERATRAFVDLYTQTKARHPHAVCHAAAHSNGTYLVANALREHGYIKLHHVYLCGSVLSPKFEWPGLVGGPVRSDRAMQDWPVGVLCRMLSWVGRIPLVGVHYKLLGTGGIDGFRMLHDAEGNQVVFENFYLPGGHGEALRPKYHEEIANFVLTGEPAGTGHVTSQVKDVKGLRGRMIATLVGLAVAAAAFALPAVFGPACAAWGIVVGALTLLLVLRVGMAV
jgi:hypothetical protein